MRCLQCGTVHRSVKSIAFSGMTYGVLRHGGPPEWLKKFEPPPVDEVVEHQEEITA